MFRDFSVDDDVSTAVSSSSCRPLQPQVDEDDEQQDNDRLESQEEEEEDGEEEGDGNVWVTREQFLGSFNDREQEEVSFKETDEEDDEGDKSKEE